MIQGPVLVTGASRGIGRAVAAALAERKVETIGTLRDPGAVADRIPGVRYLPLRLEDPKSIDDCLREAGPIEALVNNAGQSQLGAFEDTPVEAVEELFAMNVFGLLRLTRAVLPAMRERGRGTIVNIGSLTGMFPPPFQSGYAATKLALEAFTKSLRQETRGFGIRVTLIVPGYIRTRIGVDSREFAPQTSAYTSEFRQFRGQRLKKLEEAVPPEAAAQTILRAMESRNPKPIYYTGKNVPLIAFLKRMLSERKALKIIRNFYRLS
jgi:short-subunit dehydrogenase